MVREFHRQARRLELLSRYKAILVYSPHLQHEFARHGLHATCVGPPIEPGPPPCADDRADGTLGDECHLIFVGRMEPLKGGRYLLDALPRVAASFPGTINVTFAGDGPSRPSWQRSADTLMAREARIRIAFSGWLTRDRIEALLARADLLVVPSIWPEPFGLVGLEAARHRLPVAAFAVGGIRDWLRQGVNGQLAPGDPPTPRGLAEAIVTCLKDPDTHARLREGAGRIATEFDFNRHVDALMDVLQAAATV